MDEAIEAIRKVAPFPPMPDDIPEEVEMIWSYLSGAMEEVKLLPTFEYPLVSDGWIPVSERLPDNSEYVIALQSYSDSILVSYYSGGKWHSDSEYQIAGITHWQPLPKPPTK